MHEDVIAHMRGRIRRIRKVIDMAHDPGMIAMLEEMVAEAAADIRKLETDPGGTP